MARNLVMALVICLASSAAYATVTTSTRSIEYTGNATTGPWAATFHFLESDHLVVTKTLTATGVAVSPFTEGSQYTVTLPVGSVAGYVTTTAAVSAAYTIKIERIVPITQETSFKTQGRFRAASHEDAVDKLTMIAQQLSATTQTGSAIDDAITAHEGLADPHVGYFLLAGRSGGQHGKGGTGSGENLQLSSTAHATKGDIILGAAGTIVVDENSTPDRLGVGTASPTDTLHVSGTTRLAGNTDITGTLDVSAATVLATTLGVTGATTITGTLAANGATTVDDTLHVTGVTTLDGIVYGVDSSGGDLALRSTVNGTKGSVIFGTSGTTVYDETTDSLGLGTAAPGTTSSGVQLVLDARSPVVLRKHYYIMDASPHTIATDGSECNSTLYSGADGQIVMLPDINGGAAATTMDGCELTFINTCSAGNCDLTLDYTTGGFFEVYGTCGANTFTGVGAADQIQNTKATAKRGDYMRLVALNGTFAAGHASGKISWFVVGCSGVWAELP